MSDCIFCKIVAGEIPSVKIWENDDFIAILDVFPSVKGMTLVLPKQHHGSDVIAMDDELYSDFFLAAKKVAAILKKWLWLHRVAIVMEWMGINHAHIKLYPLHGVGPEWKEYRAKDPIFFEQYEGYLSTQLGPKADMDELQKLADEIK